MLTTLKKLLIPSKENDFKPDVLQRVSVGVMLVLILITFTAANIQALVWLGSEWLVSTILPAVIVELTNEERTVHALRHVRRNEVLDRAATLKAEHMAAHEYFAHYSPDGTSPWYWFDTAGYEFVHAGENLAVHFTDSNEVVKAWMNSPGHRANILSGNFTEIGIGTAQGTYNGYPTVYVVQLFGAPAAHTPSLVQAESEVQGDATTIEVTTDSGEEDVVAPATFETAPAEELEVPKESVKLAERAGVTDIETSEVVTVYSDFATTSRDAVPATVTPGTGTTFSDEDVSVIARSAVAPSLWLQAVYGFLALFVVVALILSIVIEWRRQHPVQIAYGGGLLAVMALLFYIHTAITSGVTII